MRSSISASINGSLQCGLGGQKLYNRRKETFWIECGLREALNNDPLRSNGTLLAPQSGALRISAYRDFHPIPSHPIPSHPLIGLSVKNNSMVIWNRPWPTVTTSWPLDDHLPTFYTAPTWVHILGTFFRNWVPICYSGSLFSVVQENQRKEYW